MNGQVCLILFQIFTSTETAVQYLLHKIDSVHTNDTGGYLCMASLPNMQTARWNFMYLQVVDCAGERLHISLGCKFTHKKTHRLLTA